MIRREPGGTHWRDAGMSAEKMQQFADTHRLSSITQELVNWGTRRALIDCCSTLTRPGSDWDREAKVLRNGDFMREAAYCGTLSDYCAS